MAPIFVERSGQNRIWVVKGANDHLSPADVDAASALLLKADFIVLQLEIPLETVYHTLRFAWKHDIRTILNPAPGQALDMSEAANADYVIPNETEAEVLSGTPVGSVKEARACAQGLLRSGLRRVIVTLGGNGALVVGSEAELHVPPFPVATVDTTGAGDAFIGSLACFLGSVWRRLKRCRAPIFTPRCRLPARARRSLSRRRLALTPSGPGEAKGGAQAEVHYTGAPGDTREARVTM